MLNPQRNFPVAWPFHGQATGKQTAHADFRNRKVTDLSTGKRSLHFHPATVAGATRF
jgi:hypothetical protein